MNHSAMKTTILSVTALTLCAGLSAQATAGAMDETYVQGSTLPSRTVTYERAELATVRGRARIERQIENAARAVCGPTDYRLAGSLSQVNKNRACTEAAIASAMSKVGTDRIAAID